MSTISNHLEPFDFTAIYQKFYKRVYAIAIKISRDVFLAEDIIQETFMKAFKKMDTIMDSSKIGPWLSKIASNTAIDFMRRDKKTNETLTDYNDFNKIENEWLKAVYRAKEITQFDEQEISEEIMNLNPKERSIFNLKYQDGLKEEEIAHKLNISRAAVKSRLYRARQNIKTGLMNSHFK